MSLKSIFTLLFVCTFIGLQAQKETWHWYFGDKAGIDFSSGIPIADTNGKINMMEGVSSISDTLGNLLFYTNGMSIKNKLHATIDNYSFLYGDLSTTQSAQIIKQPGNDSIYYIFTLDSYENYGSQIGHRGFRYSTVNILCNNGLGSMIQKNILICNNNCEQITAIKHCNGRDIWIIVALINSNTYHAYLLSSSGLDTNAIISQTGVGSATNSWCAGYMKATPDGKKLVACHADNWSYGASIELFDFDNATGILSNPIPIDSYLNYLSNYSYYPYGIEFSPNRRYLYVSYCTPYASTFGFIKQFDISSNNSITINSSAVQLYANYDPITHNILSESTGAIQLACNHKIYIAFYEYSYLGVINYPDSAGLSSGFVKNAVFLDGRERLGGLPTFLTGLFNIIPDYTYNQNCMNFNYSAICDTANLVSVSWNFGDGASGVNNTSGLFNPLHRFSDTGSYLVRVYYNYPCRTDSVVKTINVQLPPYVFPQSYILDSTTTLCRQLSFMTVCDSASLDSLVWDFGDLASGVNNSSTEFNPFHTFTDIGNYQIKLILYAYCRTDTIYKMVNVSLPSVYLGADTTLCDAATMVLNPNIQTNLPTTYHWQNGDTSSTFTVTQAGTYWVMVNAGGCLFSDTIQINYQYSPNVILPNDTVICEDSRIDINIPNGDYSLSWDDGSSAFSRIINETGNYWIRATNECGSSTDYFNLMVKSCNCYLYFPNAFTPNEDNKNECFGAVYECEFESFQLSIYDRWGELIFKTSNPAECWYGKLKNNKVKSDTYVWVVTYKSIFDIKSITKRGVVTVVR